MRWPPGEGGPLYSSAEPSIESVAKGRASASAGDVWVRDPDGFIAGEPHRHFAVWDQMTKSHPQRNTILDWIKNGVPVKQFIVPFKGKYRNEPFNHSFPPNKHFPNNRKCKLYKNIISREIENKIAMGAIRVWGKVGETPPPAIVMPFSIEPSKPRLVHDQQYLNCFMRPCPFSLDQVINLPRYLSRDSFHTKLDDKSGFDHFFISKDSQPYMGAEWGGWWLVWRTLPQGWKESPYIYQTLGMVATHVMRELGVPCSQYIDDRHLGELWGSEIARTSSLDAANCAFFVAATVLTQLGYFLHIAKCVSVPTRRLIFLGHLVDTEHLTFSLPEEKKHKFIALREEILSLEEVTLTLLQRFQGKCISLTLMVPAAQLYTRMTANAISRCQRLGTPVKLEAELQAEIMHWRFIDTWSGCVPWRTEDHRVVQTLASDASQSRWGATLTLPEGLIKTGDYFSQQLGDRDIAIKEAYALLYALQAFSSHLENTRVDALVDNKVLYHAWLRQGCRNQGVNQALKSIFDTTLRYNMALSIQWIPSASNPADQPSREWSDADAQLAQPLWERVEELHGPHTIDLMALDSNSKCPRHYTPSPSPLSTGLNFFSQNPLYDVQGRVENGYIFPPIYLIGPAIRHILTAQATATVIVPGITPRPFWWPTLLHHARDRHRLARQGDTDALIWPSKKHGFHQPRNLPLPWDLWAFRLVGLQPE